MSKETSKLEKKILEKGYSDFRAEIIKASQPLLSVFSKYGLSNGSKIPEGMRLSIPYAPSYENTIVSCTADSLKCLDDQIIKMYMNELQELKDRLEEIDPELN